MIFGVLRKTSLEACQYVLEPEGDLCAPCYLKLSGKEYGIRINPVQHQTSQDSSLTFHGNIGDASIIWPDYHLPFFYAHIKTLVNIGCLEHKGLTVYLPEPLPD